MPLFEVSNLRMRDPFVVPVAEEKRYYMYRARGLTDRSQGIPGFDVFTSTDLVQWEGPKPVYDAPADMRPPIDLWAPEVYRYRMPGVSHDQWIMFATFRHEGVLRGTRSLIADHPAGPFTALSSGGLTPADWECLDGHLHIDPQGQPWIIFCHEWIQVGDGTIEAMRLTPDLRQTIGQPVQLFHGSAAPWVRQIEWHKQPGFMGCVTDGPFIVSTPARGLLMLWSSFGVRGYAMGLAASPSGQVPGPWHQIDTPLITDDGGHGMVFNTFDGQMMLTFHRPNIHPHERAVFFPIRLQDGRIRLVPAT